MAQQAEVATFWKAIQSSLDSLLKTLEGLDAEQLNWRPPAPETNSLYALATHTLGNAEELILGILAGQPVHRDRESEFRATGDSAAALAERWSALRGRMDAALAALPDGAPDRDDYQHPRRGQISGREALLIVARHAAEHTGQAELTRDLLRAGQVR